MSTQTTQERINAGGASPLNLRFGKPRAEKDGPHSGLEPGAGRVAEMFALLQNLARHAENDLRLVRERHARNLLHILTRG